MAGLVLVDANVLARAVHVPDPQHATVLAAIDRLLALGADVAYTPQAVRETYHFYTRPIAANGFGLDQAKALALLDLIDDGPMALREDTPDLYREWRGILATTHVLGAQAHDAYHAAAVRAHGASHFLTLDRKDFDRYARVEVLRPGQVLEPNFGLNRGRSPGPDTGIDL